MTGVLEQLHYAYGQRAVAELLLLAVASAAIGPWIAMRALAFFAHAIGTAAFPGLIAADALGIAPLVGASAAAGIVAVGSGATGAQNARGSDGTRTGLWLTGSLAVGALIASRSQGTGGGIESALFGNLLTISAADLTLAAAVAAAAVAAATLGGPRWLDGGLTGSRHSGWDALLRFIVAACAISQLAAAGSLLAAALLVLPAVAARPWITSVGSWQRATFALSAATALAGLTIALAFDLPPGGVIAVAAGAAVACSHCLKALCRGSGPRRLAAGITALLAAVGTGGCASPPKPGGVVATTPIIGSIVSSVAGPDTEVTVLVPAGVDPHTYEPRPSDVEALAGAKLIVAGGGLDSWISRAAERTGSNAPLLILNRQPMPTRLAFGAGGTDLKPAHSQSASGRMDPHWFHDPLDVAAAAEATAAALSRVNPSDAAGYRARAEALARQAAALLRQGRDCIAKLPPHERRLVTDHDAFGYLANTLGLQQTGTLITSGSTAAAPSARQLTALSERIRQLRIKAIFPETALDPKLTRRIAQQTGATADTQLDADTLGPNGSGRDTWSGMWAGNVNRIAHALSGGTVTCEVGT